MPEPTRVQVKLKLRVLPLLIAALGILELVWAERVWMMLVVTIGGIWLLDFLWARALAGGLRLQRELRYDWAHIGDEIEERFTLSDDARAPALWVEIQDHSTLPDYTASVATGVEAHSENTWRIKHVCTRRGIFKLGPTVITSGTPFAIYEVKLEYMGQQAVMVMPRTVPLPDIEVAPGGRAHEGRQRASTLEPTVSVAGVREYRPGDPFKAIFWRAVAHYDDFIVRTFESTPAGDWWVLVNLDAGVQAGEGENSTLEHSIVLAASLATRGLNEGRAVGVVANGHDLVWLAPQAGETQRLQILRALATVEPGAAPLATLLSQTQRAFYRNSSVVIITPSAPGMWLDAILSLAGSGATPTVLLLDPASYGGTGDAIRAKEVLAEWKIPCYVLERDSLVNMETEFPREGHWDWTVGATGRAIPRSTPRDQAWRPLA